MFSHQPGHEQTVDTSYDIAVIGAGMVGTSSALWLLRSGHRVALIDRGEPGMGTSFGNAGALATYGNVPINSPSIPRRIPELLFSKDSPLHINWTMVPGMMPWLIRFLRNCTPGRVEYISGALASLMQQAEEGVFPLFKASGADKLIRSMGCLYLYDTEANFAKADGENKLRRDHGVEMEVLTPEEVGQLEPNLAKIYAKGVYFPKAHQYVSPSGVVQTMADHFTANGGTFIKADVSAIGKNTDGSLEIATDGPPISCKQLVLAAGAFTKRLFGGLVEPLPLETERGFHIVFPGHEGALNRPVGWSAGGFYMTPMSHGLRAAGTVDLGGLSSKVRQANIDHITRHARKLLPDLPETPQETWVGHRPTMPDALPVIGRSQRTPEIIFACGHQHIGMTIGGITGKLVAEIVDGTKTSVDLTPFSPGRF